MFLAALSLGILGSFHCIGMCGPIALALPVHQFSPLKKYLAILLYNLGRLTTYTALGLLFGIIGQSFFMGGFQRSLSISMGILILFFVILNRLPGYNIKLPAFYRVVNPLKQKLGKLFHQKGLPVLFFIGLLNGLLPCGMVYLGIAGAMATGHYLQSMEFMFWFGMGTVPVMYSVAFLGQYITLRSRNLIRQSMPYMISLMAVLLIVRGLNLGIPYLSPEFEEAKHRVSCCESVSNASEKDGKLIKSCCSKK